MVVQGSVLALWFPPLLIKCIETQIGKTYGKGFSDRAATMEVGFIWEDVLEHQFAQRMGNRPDEVVVDPIIASPDGIGLDPEDDSRLVLEEYKCTWTSTNKDISGRWAWLVQTKTYCHMLGLDTVVFYCLHLCGNYRDKREPTFLVYRIQYSERELAENWAMIVNNAGAVLAEKYGE